MKTLEGYPCCWCRTYCCKIYSLSDIEGNIFYVGVTTQELKSRLALHISESRYVWLNHKPIKSEKIISSHYHIEIKELDRILISGKTSRQAIGKAMELEHYWINRMIELGHELVNIKGVKRVAA